MQLDETQKRAFGNFLKERRISLGITNKELCEKLNISGGYLVDIEKGNRRAPLKLLPTLEQILLIQDDEKNNFYDLAYQSHGNHPDINEYLDSHPIARQALRLAKAKGLSDQEFSDCFNQMIQEMQNKKENQSPIEQEEQEK